MKHKTSKLLLIIALIIFKNTCSANNEININSYKEYFDPIKEYITCPALLYVLALESHAFKANEKAIKLEKNCMISAGGFILSNGIKKDNSVTYNIQSENFELKYYLIINLEDGSIKINSDKLLFNGYIENLIENIQKKMIIRNVYYMNEIKKIEITALKNKELIKNSNTNELLAYSLRNIINSRSSIFMGNYRANNSFLNLSFDFTGMDNQLYDVNRNSLVDKIIEVLRFVIFGFIIHKIYKK